MASGRGVGNRGGVGQGGVFEGGGWGKGRGRVLVALKGGKCTRGLAAGT